MKNTILLLFIVGLSIAASFVSGCKDNISSATAQSTYDNFAKCLADNGVKMYGAYWCPHCNSQKQMLGESWKYVNYIECSLPDSAGQTQDCSDAGIMAYPTWEFKDGTKVEGGLSLEQLSQNSGCSLGT